MQKTQICMHGDKCRYRHVDVLCVDKDCNVFKCEKRHPKICNYFRDFGQCKLTTFCRYKHFKIKDAFDQRNGKEIK